MDTTKRDKNAETEGKKIEVAEPLETIRTTFEKCTQCVLINGRMPG
jgi:hypothetical protein